VRETRERGERARRTLLTESAQRGAARDRVARARRRGLSSAARGEIGASLESGAGSLRGQAQELASQAASQVLGRAL
jgi:hypothetical protein